MKQLKPLLSLLTLCVLISVSCKKSNPKPASILGIAFMFNDTAKSSLAPVALYNKSEDAMVITGALGASSSVQLSIPTVKVGTFDLDGSGAGAEYVPNTNGIVAYGATSGNITVTSFTSSTISGTFQFSATFDPDPNFVGVAGIPTAGAITHGSFTVNYTITTMRLL